MNLNRIHSKEPKCLRYYFSSADNIGASLAQPVFNINTQPFLSMFDSDRPVFVLLEYMYNNTQPASSFFFCWDQLPAASSINTQRETSTAPRCTGVMGIFHGQGVQRHIPLASDNFAHKINHFGTITNGRWSFQFRNIDYTVATAPASFAFSLVFFQIPE